MKVVENYILKRTTRAAPELGSPELVSGLTGLNIPPFPTLFPSVSIRPVLQQNSQHCALIYLPRAK